MGSKRQGKIAGLIGEEEKLNLKTIVRENEVIKLLIKNLGEFRASRKRTKWEEELLDLKLLVADLMEKRNIPEGADEYLKIQEQLQGEMQKHYIHTLNK